MDISDNIFWEGSNDFILIKKKSVYLLINEILYERVSFK